MSFNWRYNYYESPEGKNVAMKTYALGRYAVAAGLIMGTSDVLMYSHAKGFVPMASRYLYHTGPLLGMAAAFTVTSNVACNIRNRDDQFNYALGGLAAGAIYGMWQKTAIGGLPVALFLAGCAMVKKVAIDEGWILFPEPKQMTNSITSVRNDWTLHYDLPKGWSTGQ